MTNRSEANKLASKITGETVNASTTKGALEAISGKKAGSIAQGDIPSGDVTVEELTVTENGTYTAPEGKAYSPVNVNVAGGGFTKLYAWERDSDNFILYATFGAAPDNISRDTKLLKGSDDTNTIVYASISTLHGSDFTVQKVSDNEFKVIQQVVDPMIEPVTITYSRVPMYITLE
jgi:hypothetical protein